MVDTLKGEAFGFLGFDLRRVHKRTKDGYTIQMTPKKKARKAVKAKIRDIIRSGGATPVPVIVGHVNAAVAGWVNYFRVGNSSRAFSEVRDEMKIRTLLTRRKRRRKTSIGWRRWSNAYVYGWAILGLENPPLARRGDIRVKVAAMTETTHNSSAELHRVSCLRENLTSSSYGEELETGPTAWSGTAPVPYPTTHDCVAQPLPPPRQGLGKSQPQRPRVLETRVHPPHVAKAL